MEQICCVPKCGRSKINTTEKIRLYKFPTHKKIDDFCEERKYLWALAARRPDLAGIEKSLDRIRICSKHFLFGAPAKYDDFTNPDWIPTQSMPPFKAKKDESKLHRYLRHLKRTFPPLRSLPKRVPADQCTVLNPIQKVLIVDAQLRPVNIPATTTSSAVVTCCIQTCIHSNQNTDCDWFKLPEDAKVRAKWLRNMRGRVLSLNLNSLICSCHFRKSDGMDKGPTYFASSLEKSYDELRMKIEVERMKIPQGVPNMNSESIANVVFKSETDMCSALQMNSKDSNQEKDYNFSKICRVCLADNPTQDIFEYKTADQIKIVDMIDDVIGYECTPEENRPRRICTKCLKDLYLSYQLIKRFQTSEHTLRNYLKTAEHRLTLVKECINEEHNYQTVLPQLIEIPQDDLTEIETTDTFDTINIDSLDLTNVQIENETTAGSMLKQLLESDVTGAETHATATGAETHATATGPETHATATSAEEVLEGGEPSADALEGRSLESTSWEEVPDTHENEEDSFEWEGDTLNEFSNIKVDIIDTLIELYSLKSNSFSNYIDKHQLSNCKYCNKLFMNHNDLLQHNCGNPNPILQNVRILYRKTGDTEQIDTFQCRLCKKTFSNLTVLVSHECFAKFTKKREGVCAQKFYCRQCNAQFQFYDELVKHRDEFKHTGEAKMSLHDKKPHECVRCGEKFEFFSQLIKHQRDQRHNSVPAYRKCGICGVYLNRTEVAGHKKMHAGERRFMCEKCGRKFKTTNNFVRHMDIHNGIKRLQCKECDRWFRQHTALRAHMRIHTGEKPYVCEGCGRRFRQLGSLNFHRKNQRCNLNDDSDLLYSCSVCKKKFYSRTRLNSHLKTHVNVK